MTALLSLTIATTVTAQGSSTASKQQPEKTKVKAVEKVALGSTVNVHRTDKLILAGQFAKEDIAEIKQAKVKRVINLRTDGEISWDYRAALKQEGLELIEIPFRSPDSLNDEVFGKIRKLLKDEAEPTLLHCGSANRVGGVWLPFRVLDQGVDLETAIKEAEKVGLRTPFIKQKAIDYIKRQQQKASEKQGKDDTKPEPNVGSGSTQNQAKREALKSTKAASVKPGINKSFLDPDLDPDRFVKRFEIESREIFALRSEIVNECDIESGQSIADVGAGTGLFTRLFAEAVGEQGWVFAVDVSPRLVEFVNLSASEQKIENVTTVLCAEDDVNLPPKSVDLVFVCDTYHHFEYPASTMASIHRALRDDGRLIVIDFDRIEGVSREFIMGHVRAGKDIFRAEIQDSGFAFQTEVPLKGLQENYFLVFRKS